MKAQYLAIAMLSSVAKNRQIACPHSGWYRGFVQPLKYDEKNYQKSKLKKLLALYYQLMHGQQMQRASDPQ